MKKTILLAKPENFSFRHTLYSHGWSSLRPFELDDEKLTLGYVFSDKKDFKKTTHGIISESDESIKIELEDPNNFEIETILRDVRHILRLDDDLGEFYALVEKERSLAWIAETKAGRLLRSPTVFEDLVKTICTTNCSWSATEKMVGNLVEKLGAPTESGKRAFPTPEAMASVPADFYRDEIRAGYRAQYFAELAESVAAGRLDPEKWLDSNLPTRELKKEMKKVKGVGDYAAENLLKLVGSYEGLALDSWVRAQFYKKHNAEQVCADRDIERFYERFGAWRGLALWCDMTEKWFA